MVESYAFLGDPEIRLTTNTTITYDARTAAEAKVTTQRPTERKGGSLTYGRVIDNWILASSRSYGKQIKAIYLGTTTKARRGTFEVVEGWQYASPAGAKSPYLYSLAFTHEQQIKGKPEHRVRDRELATIDATYYTPGKDYTYSEYVDVWRPWSINLIPTGDRGAVAAPTRVRASGDGRPGHEGVADGRALGHDELAVRDVDDVDGHVVPGGKPAHRELVEGGTTAWHGYRPDNRTEVRAGRA